MRNGQDRERVKADSTLVIMPLIRVARINSDEPDRGWRC
jgi:hypothetical protein